MWRELSKIRRPTEGDEYGDEYQKILIFIAQPRELSFTSEKMLRLSVLQVILVYIFITWNYIFF